MFKISKKNYKRQCKYSLFSSVFNLINFTISVILFLILDSLHVKMSISLIVSFCVLLIIIILDFYYYNNFSLKLKVLEKMKIMQQLILIYVLNDPIELSIVKAYENVFNETINEEDIKKKIALIKIKIDNIYFNIFIDACLKKSNTTFLNKIIKQIDLFLEKEKINEKMNALLNLKYLFFVSLLVVLFLVNSIFLGNKYVFFCAIFLLTFIYYIIYYLISHENKENVDDVFFNYFYIYAMFERPYIAFDLAFDSIETNKDKLTYDKQKILKSEFANNLINFNNEFKKKYLLIVESLRNNLIIKEYFIDKNLIKDYQNYYLKFAELLYILIPITTYVIERFYL